MPLEPIPSVQPGSQLDQALAQTAPPAQPQVGSPLQGITGASAPTDPGLAGLPEGTEGAFSGSDFGDFAQVVAAYQQSGGLPGQTQKFEDQPVPGYPSLSVASYLKQFYRAPVGKVVRLQRTLVAAGYLQKDDVGSMGDIFDPATMRALNGLVEDSVFSGYRPGDILGYRVGIRAGQKPGQLQAPGSELERNEMDQRAWERSMADTYAETWGGQTMPPGYLADKAQMNPDELAVFERAKVFWQQSGVAEQEQKRLTRELTSFFSQRSSQQQVPPGAGG